MKTAVNETDFQDLDLIKRGKVRDIYDLGENLLMVATDRISAFDVVMPDPVRYPGKTENRPIGARTGKWHGHGLATDAPLWEL